MTHYPRTPTRAETEVYIDLDVLIEKETAETADMENLIRERQELIVTAKEATDRRKEIDSLLMNFIDDYSAGGLVLKTWVVDKINRKGSGKWNKDKLMQILTPQQIEEVYSTGSASSHIQVKADPDAAAKARAG